MSLSTTSTTASTPSPRKVTFAPLPSPRHTTQDSVDRAADDDDEEDSLDSSSHSAKFMAAFNSDTINELLGGGGGGGGRSKRRSSNASMSPPKEGTFEAWSIPLVRWTSLGSDRGRSKADHALPSTSSTKFATPPHRSTSQDGGGKSVKGRRMLNGRVYKPEALSDDEKPKSLVEPEFVEWGCSGFGSVATPSSSHGEGGRKDTDADEDSDDQSGMAWVKKRRQQRANALLNLN